jgi:hypothetical protein
VGPNPYPKTVHHNPYQTMLTYTTYTLQNR